MRIKPFNEIMAELKGAGSTNRSEEIEELANQLLKQGIATSKLEAREKAKSMISTEDVVNEEFSEKQPKLTTYNDPRNNPKYNKYREAMVLEMRQRAMSKRDPIKIQDEFQTPGYEAKNGSAGLPRAVLRSETAPQRSESPEKTRTEPDEAQKKATFDSIDINKIFKY